MLIDTGASVDAKANDDHSLKGRMEIAAMNDKYLLGMLANAVRKF